MGLYRPQRRLPAGATVAALAAFVAATLSCDGGTVEPVPPFTLSIERSEVEEVVGFDFEAPGTPTHAQTLSFLLHRNGYQGAITFTIDTVSMPFAATRPPLATIRRLVEDSGSVTFQFSSVTSAGDFLYRLRATAGTQGSVTADIQVRVIPFDLRPMVRELTVGQGETNTISLAYVGLRNLTVTSGPTPPGISVATSSFESSGFVDVTASDQAQLGTFTLTLDVSTPLYPDLVSREVSVSVIPAQPKRPVAFRICRSQGKLFGPDKSRYYTYRYTYANEGSAWVYATLDDDDVIRFNATDRVAVAEFFVLENGDDYAPYGLRVIYLTADELERMQCPSATQGGSSFPVIAAGATQHIAALGAWRALNGMTEVPKKDDIAADLIATATQENGDGLAYRGIVRRDQNPAKGDTIRLNFDSTEAVVLDSAQLDWGSGTGEHTVYLHTTSTVGRIIRGVGDDTQYRAFPASQLEPEDVQSLVATRDNIGQVHWFRTAAPLTLTFGPALLSPSIDVEAQTITLPFQSEYPDIAGVGQRREVYRSGLYSLLEIWQSRAYRGETPSPWVFTRPDLGRVGRAQTLTDDAVGAMAVSGPAHLVFGGTPAPGTELRWATSPAPQFAATLPFPRGR